MAITTYSELQTAAANWLARADLTSRIPEFIALCEADVNTRLRTIDQETKNATFSITGEYVAVPTGFLAVRSFQLDTSERQPLQFATDEYQTSNYKTTGVPKFYSIVGSNFRFAPVPDATYSSTLVYYTKLVGLATTSPNWLLTNHPDVYLYGTLVQSKMYVHDDPRAQEWMQMYIEGIERLKRHNNLNRWSGPGLQTRPG